MISRNFIANFSILCDFTKKIIILDGGRGGGTGNRPNRTGERQFSLESFSSQKNEFKFSVKVADKGTVMLSSSNLDLVKSAKIALEEHFSGKSYSVAPLGSGVPPPAGHRMDILRIPIYENSSVAQIHLAEAEDARSKERRAKFAKTAANRKLNEANKNDAGKKTRQIIFLANFFCRSLQHWKKISKKVLSCTILVFFFLYFAMIIAIFKKKI